MKILMLTCKSGTHLGKIGFSNLQDFDTKVLILQFWFLICLIKTPSLIWNFGGTIFLNLQIRMMQKQFQS